VEAFSVTVAVTADAQHFAAVRDFLPPRARPVRHLPERGRFALVENTDNGLLSVVCDEEPVMAFLIGGSRSASWTPSCACTSRCTPQNMFSSMPELLG
jgi:hypothetical protein